MLTLGGSVLLANCVKRSERAEWTPARAPRLSGKTVQ